MGNVTVPPSVGWPTTTASEPPMGNVTVPPSVGWPTTTASEPPVLNGTVQVPTLNLTVPPKLTTVSVMKNGTKAPDLSPVCPLDCDFEQDFCQWSQMLTDVFDWERRNGSTSTLTTGPPSDHTTGDGHYLHIEANRASLGDAARLISNKCSDTGPQCLMFWYHMHGSADTMGLQVYLLEDKLATVLWTRRNDQGNEWQLAQVNLVKNGTFQIIFEGRKGANDESDVALDDIKLLHGVCKDLVKPTTAVPATLSTRGHVPATPSNESGPRPSPTAGLLVPATASNETGPRASPTAGLHLPTAQGNGTAEPQVPATAKPAPSNETGPRPSPTAGPQVPPTAKPAPSNETGPRPSPTTGPQVTPTAKPAPLNETGLRPSPTAGPHLPTAQGNGTAEPQATAKPAPSNETGPRPSPTAGLHLPTAQGNGTAEPQATAKPAPSNETGPRVSPTTGPKVPATTRLEPSPKTESHPSNTTGPQMTPEILPTNELQVPTLRPNLSTFTMRLQETVVPQPGPSCAENSHYTTCIPACKPTCENLNVPPQCSAEKTCVAGCVCDDGFVQKGSVCMPLQRCGCINGNGTTYNFNEIWYIDHCTKKCECEEDDGKGDIHCKDKAGCEGDAVCLHLERGKYYCEATEFGECTIQGDPEYKTFDKLKHDFSGTSIYVLVRTKNLPENLPEIYIEGTNTCTDDSQNDSEEKDWSTSDEDDAEIHKSLQELKIKVYNHTVELKHQRKVFVDGQRIRVPGSSAPGLEIQMHSSQIYLKTDFGLSVEFSGHCKTEIILPFLYKRRVEGLCGNFDGRKTNEKVKPDGTIAKNTHDFGESWRV